jgi:hypothetical protein
MVTPEGRAAHVWRAEAKAGDLCLCGRRILPLHVDLPARLQDQDAAS